MKRIVNYKKITPFGKKLGWDKVKVLHIIDEKYEYKEFYYISESGQYFEHLYKTVWLRKDW